MKCEVYIDNQLVDTHSSNAVGYEITSPIFRDIKNITSNRTTTYKLPKTSNNSRVFGFSDNTDVYSVFPYEKHEFAEYRDGMPFINGYCYLLATNETDFEIGVIWGNYVNLASLEGLDLRSLKSNKYINWDIDTQYLNNNSNEDIGFCVVDYGLGIKDVSKSRPCITMQGILDIIEESQGVKIEYPNSLQDVLKRNWIPLLDNNANGLNWIDKGIVCFATRWFIGNNLWNTIYLETTDNKNNILDDFSSLVFNDEDLTLKVRINTVFRDLDPKLANNRRQNARVGIYINQKYEYVSQVIEPNDSGIYIYDGVLEYENKGSQETGDLRISVFISYENWSQNSAIQELEIDYFNLDATFETPKVEFGDKYPICPNLPDISVIDYIKTIMQMYGLYAYYREAKDNESIVLVSIDDVYNKKTDAYIWTDKIVNTNRGRYEISYRYGDYARKNTLDYKKDDNIKVDTLGYIELFDQTIKSEIKEIAEIPFYASINRIDQTNNAIEYAKLDLIDLDGKVKDVRYTILSTSDTPYISEDLSVKKTLYFSDRLKFGGSSGLVSKYYGAFQKILSRPIVVSFYVRFDSYDLFTYREATPVYIDGVYYMPIEITVQTDGLATCKMIRMPK